MLQPDGTSELFGPEALIKNVGSAGGERDLHGYSFRAPRLKLGSIIEYAHVIRSPWLQNSDEQERLSRYPLKHYEFELTTSKNLVLETIELNATAPIETRSLMGDRYQLRFTLDQLASLQDADYAPHWSFVEPRWAWRGVAFNQKVRVPWLES